MLPPFAPTCCAKRTVHTRTVRFFRSESCAEKRLFSVGSPLPPCLLSRFFLEEKKQKKIHCRSVVFPCSRRLRQRAAQNGRFIREPSVFSFRIMCGKAPFLRRVTSPAVPFVSFLLRRKEAKENPLPKRCFPMLPPLAPTCCAKRTVHTRTVRFFVSFVSFLQERKLFPAIVYPIR